MLVWVAGCGDDAATVHAAALPPAAPFETTAGDKARGWHVAPEHAGEVIARVRAGENLPAVLADLEQRKPGTVGGQRRTEASATAPTPASPTPAPGAEREAVAKLTRRFTLIEGQEPVIASVAAAHGLWQIRFRAADVAADAPLREAWVSADGKAMFAPGVDLDAEIEELEADRAFARCLRDAGVRAYVDVADAAGRAQVAALGRFGGLVLVDCAASPDVCRASGAATLPAVAVGQALHLGAQPRDRLRALTGCR